MKDGCDLTIDEGRLVFRTESFRVQRGSILHSGIYNREMASVVSASAMAGFFFVLIAFNRPLGVLDYLAASALFIAGFVFARTVIFKERTLVLEINKKEKKAKIRRPGLMAAKKEDFGLSEVDSVGVSFTKISPENPDAVRVVEKIALQHGTVIPGFGAELEIYAVEIRLTDGSKRVVYAAPSEEKAREASEKIEGFIINAKEN